MNSSTKSNGLISTGFSLLLTLFVSACGGGGGGDDGGSSSPGGSNYSQRKVTNTVPVSVYSAGDFYALNMPFVSVTVREPSGSNCTTIDNVLLDTGSVGLRIFASAVSKINLKQQTMTTGNSAGNAIAECLTFTQGVTWGPIKNATVKIGEKIANNIPIQLISDPAFTTIPTVCTNEGTALTTTKKLGANGILGVGFTREDTGWYFQCDGTGKCTYTQSVQHLVPNPVAKFDSDNNGVIITLGAVPDDGTSAINGTLIFGIDTQTNNTSTHTNTVLVDNDPNSPTYGYFNTNVNGVNYPYSFIDSGSNGIFFNFPSPITECFLYPGFYCPGKAITFNATITSNRGNAAPISFSFDIGNASTLLANYDYYVYDNLGGTSYDDAVFNWGLPFFLGKSVYIAMDNTVTSKGTGPYVGW